MMVEAGSIGASIVDDADALAFDHTSIAHDELWL